MKRGPCMMERSLHGHGGAKDEAGPCRLLIDGVDLCPNSMWSHVAPQALQLGSSLL